MFFLPHIVFYDYVLRTSPPLSLSYLLRVPTRGWVRPLYFGLQIVIWYDSTSVLEIVSAIDGDRFFEKIAPNEGFSIFWAISGQRGDPDYHDLDHRSSQNSAGLYGMPFYLLWCAVPYAGGRYTRFSCAMVRRV